MTRSTDPNDPNADPHNEWQPVGKYCPHIRSSGPPDRATNWCALAVRQGEPVAWLKEWHVDGAYRRHVNLYPACERWLLALNPTITPLYAHPAPQPTKFSVCLPDGDPRTAKVIYVDRKIGEIMLCIVVEPEHPAPAEPPIPAAAMDALRRLWPLIERGTRGFVFTADKAGEVAADMAALRAAMGDKS
jgi:hypothetical protein